MESFMSRSNHSENISLFLRTHPQRSFVTVFEGLRTLKHANRSQIVSDMLASRLKHKQRTFLNDCISHLSIVESDSLSVVHLIARKFLSCELHRYELQRLPDMNFQIKDTMSSNVSLRNNFCLYARVFDSPDTIACLSGRNLNIIKYDHDVNDYIALQSIYLGRKYSNVQFAREPVRSFFLRPTDYARRKSVLLFNHNEVISAPRINESTVPNQRPFCKLHRQSKITAVGIANAFEESRNISIYIAKGTKFSLLPLKATLRGKVNIDFAETSSMSDIFHLQCMLSPNNDRRGVILRRKDGQIEFWEDRQPKEPAVVYHNSLIGSTAPEGGRPVVDFPCQSYVAAATGDNETIRLWKLQTGQLVNVMAPPEPRFVEDFPFPPILTLRSFWGFDGDRSSFQGPALMSIKKHVVDFFF